ncbi:hypothetical protein D046_8239A, partial [Vibrio parahaemolyticus V-223/04]
MERMLMV